MFVDNGYMHRQIMMGKMVVKCVVANGYVYCQIMMGKNGGKVLLIMVMCTVRS